MKKRYISFNERIINRLAEFGFKRKNKDFFIRNLGEDVIQQLIFGHCTHGVAHVKYYNIRSAILLPKVFKITEDLDIFLPLRALYNANIGELMPKPRPVFLEWLMPKPRPVFLEWLIGEDTDEKYDNKVIDSMLYHVEKYAIPFLDKYNSPAAIVEGIKKCVYPNRYGEDIHACIALLLYGKKEDFLWFVEKRSHELQFSIYDNSEVHWNYKNPDIPLNLNCKLFLEVIEKLRPIIEEKGIQW